MTSSGYSAANLILVIFCLISPLKSIKYYRYVTGFSGVDFQCLSCDIEMDFSKMKMFAWTRLWILTFNIKKQQQKTVVPVFLKIVINVFNRIGPHNHYELNHGIRCYPNADAVVPVTMVLVTGSEAVSPCMVTRVTMYFLEGRRPERTILVLEPSRTTSDSSLESSVE